MSLPSKEAVVFDQGCARFSGSLLRDARQTLVRAVESLGGTLDSWEEAADVGRTYAALRGPAELEGLGATLPGATIGAFSALEVSDASERALRALTEAFTGPSRPTGIRDCIRGKQSVVVEFDDAVTSLGFILDIIDVHARHRTVRLLLPISDRTLAAFVGDELAIAHLDHTRIVEHHLEESA